MKRAQQDAKPTGRLPFFCPSCRQETLHEVRMRRRDTLVLVCTVCNLASLVAQDQLRETSHGSS
ncbi:MAG: hypothetical protein IMX02_04290 [Limnochordaceae bacterium]|nr:hypothetical protein [Limnochordaceae bacterium]